MSDPPAKAQPYQSQRLIEAIATKDAVDAFIARNAAPWNAATFARYRWMLGDFATAFPALPTILQEVLDYVEHHRLKKSEYLWEVGTVRSYYKVLRRFYAWTKSQVPGAGHLMVLPPVSDRRIGNFGRKRYRFGRKRYSRLR